MKTLTFLSSLLIFSIYYSTIAPFLIMGQVQEMKEEKPKGLKFKLSEVTKNVGSKKISLVEGEKLSEEKTNLLLSQIPPIEKQEPTDFAIRGQTLKPPKTGKIVTINFEPSAIKDQPEESINKPLEVVRYSPEGNIPIAETLSVTFSHPMVAVTSQEQASQKVPVKLTPEPKGKWRWLGTKTLIFDAENRFPMATSFTATIPAGTESINNQKLQKDFTWTFTTPPPSIQKTYPSQGMQTTRDSLIFIAFDQEIDPEAMIKSISVKSTEGSLPIRLATEEEISKSEIIKEYIQQTKPKYWIVLRAVNPNGTTENVLPFDSEIKVTVHKGAPSAEGPLKTTNDQSFSFRTFGNMRFVRASCFEKPCSPFDDWFIEFTNTIDPSSFDPSMIKISPKLEDVQIYPAGKFIYISGYKKGRTSYKITIDPNLKDIYGQKLNEPATATISVGQAPPRLFPRDRFIVLDPTVEPKFSFYSINVPLAKILIYKVQPSDWYKFKDLYTKGNVSANSIPGKLVEQKTIQIQRVPDEIVETKIDLSKALVSGAGDAIVVVKPTIKLPYDEKIITWCQATQIGIDVLTDNEQLVAFITDLKTGKPVSDAEVEIYPDSIKSKSGRDGIAKLPLPKSNINSTRILIAKKDNEIAFLPEEGKDFWYETSNWIKRDLKPSIKWFVFDDRKIYKPKEEVSIKGYVRISEAGKLGDLKKPVEGIIKKITYFVSDSRQNEIAKGEALLNSFGAFDFRFKLPDRMNLGDSTVILSAETNSTDLIGSQFYHSIKVEEFRRPEFEVIAKNQSEPPYFLKESALLSVEAKYYAGGGLANADVKWIVSAKPTNYTPPNRSDFFFGIWKPWWWRDYRPFTSKENSQEFRSQTNALGEHTLKIDFESIENEPARPYNLEASVSVEDINRQRWASSTSLLVHPSSLYVGLKTKRNFVSKGESFVIESIVTDIDGNIVADRDFQIIAELTSQRFEKGKWQEVKLDEQICNLKSSKEITKCNFKANQSGQYMIKALVLDDKQRSNETHIPMWVSGSQVPKETKVEEQEVQIIPDKNLYSAGDIAELLIISPFPEAEGILTLDRGGIIKTEKISIRDSSAIVKIPILESYLPNLNVLIDIISSTSQAEKQGKPAFATGTISLKISTSTRSLNVSVEPEKKNLEPGGTTKVNFKVTDSNGAPVANSEIAVVAVDEAILALTNYKIQNPLDVFYYEIGRITTSQHLRELILLEDKYQNAAGIGKGLINVGSDVLGKVMARSPMTESSAPYTESPAPYIRKDFNPLALFLSSLKTDAKGKATVDLKLPDNLTRYRITAVSVDESGKLFGLGESNVTARQPLIIRPSPPRFMNFGDNIKLPVVLQNQTDNPINVDLAIRVSNVELKGINGKRITVPANDRVEVRFPIFASHVGIAHFQFVASSEKWSDAVELSIPVWSPATTEAFATYGTTDNNETILNKILAPKDVYEQFGGLEVTTSSTRLQELADAFIYLCDYPFESSESIASRMIAISAMQDVLNAFKVEGLPSEQKIKAKIEQDIKTLISRQRSDGSFGVWSYRKERFEYPFITVHVTHALLRSKAKGYNVPQERLEKALSYIKNIEFDDWHKKIPKLRWTVLAYSLYVRNLAGDTDSDKALKLLNEAKLENLPFEAIGWILSVLADSKKDSNEVATIKRFLMNRVAETASAANFVTNYEDGEWLIMHSNRRADGIILEALLKVDKQNDLIPKLVQGLLQHRTKGRWETTQENVFILLALRKYFDTYENVTPNLIARIWLGETYAGEQIFKGRSVDSNLLEIPMSYLVKQKNNTDLILQREGSGRLYYRIGMQYAPRDLKLKPVDYGFTVLRKYEAVDSPDDVKQNPDGSWSIRLGARVRVHLTLVAPSRRYHVALVDPLPAGLEILNPELAVTEKLPDKQDTAVFEYGSASFLFDIWWRRNWFEHQNFRDERAEAFTALLWGGVYEFSYYTRATTPGEFIVPPTKAEEMYNPETFGRTGTDFVRIQ